MHGRVSRQAEAGSDPGLLLTRKQEWVHLKICGTVRKEKGFAKRVSEDDCKNIPVKFKSSMDID